MCYFHVQLACRGLTGSLSVPGAVDGGALWDTGAVGVLLVEAVEGLVGVAAVSTGVGSTGQGRSGGDGESSLHYSFVDRKLLDIKQLFTIFVYIFVTERVPAERVKRLLKLGIRTKVGGCYHEDCINIKGRSVREGRGRKRKVDRGQIAVHILSGRAHGCRPSRG